MNAPSWFWALAGVVLFLILLLLLRALGLFGA